MMGFWKFILLIVIAPVFGAFLASTFTIARGASFQSNYGAVAWSIYAVFIAIFSIIVWKKAKPRETWDKTVSPNRQEQATQWFINEVKKDNNEK